MCVCMMYLFLFYEYWCLVCICICAPLAYSARRRQKTVSDLPKLKVWMVISHHVVRELNHGPLGKSSQCFYLRSLHRNKVWWNIAISQALGRLWYKNHNCSPFWAIKQGSVIGNLKDKKKCRHESFLPIQSTNSSVCGMGTVGSPFPAHRVCSFPTATASC